MTNRTVGTLLALAVVLLAGCTSDEKEPTVLPPAPSVSPSPPLPSFPLEAMNETSEGASAFARYYFDLLNQAYAGADATVVQRVTASGCGGCDALIAVIQRLKEDRQRSVGGEYRILSAIAPAVIDGDVIVDVSYDRSAGQIVNEKNVIVESGAPVPRTDAQLRLIRRDGSWLVQGFRVLGTA
ncbi:MAG: DUF6318 family protein [Actinomycetota bacterium]|nr:DUF6318 family protein [Actinomycetota bacterium]